MFYPKLLEGEPPPRGPWRREALVAGVGVIILWASFLMETLGWVRSAAVLRGLTTGFYFVTRGRVFRPANARTFLALMFELGVLFLLAGLFLPAFLPAFRIANLHVVFIGGFTVILFTVGTRVILGHTGQAHLFARRRLRFLVASVSLLALAMLTRVSADLFPAERNSHLVYAALIWLIAALVWGAALLPKLHLSED